MLIVSLEPGANGSRANQSLDFPLREIPEGYVQIPPELEAGARALLPWLGLELDGSGEVAGIFENTEARDAHLAALAAAEAEAD